MKRAYFFDTREAIRKSTMWPDTKDHLTGEPDHWFYYDQWSRATL